MLLAACAAVNISRAPRYWRSSLMVACSVQITILILNAAYGAIEHEILYGSGISYAIETLHVMLSEISVIWFALPWLVLMRESGQLAWIRAYSIVVLISLLVSISVPLVQDLEFLGGRIRNGSQFLDNASIDMAILTRGAVTLALAGGVYLTMTRQVLPSRMCGTNWAIAVVLSAWALHTVYAELTYQMPRAPVEGLLLFPFSGVAIVVAFSLSRRHVFQSCDLEQLTCSHCGYFTAAYNPKRCPECGRTACAAG